MRKRKNGVSCQTSLPGNLNSTVYELHLDMTLTFVPLMESFGRGIRLTRVFTLPFVPFDGLILSGAAFREDSDPMGFKLEDITWDVDRQVFLGDTSLEAKGLPIAYISDEVQAWVNRGWTLGSYADAYPSIDDDEDESEVEYIESELTDEYTDVERWPEMSPRKRPAEFNKLIMALVRELVILWNNLATAYAIDRTKMFFSEEELKRGDSPAKKKFWEAQREYDALSFEDQMAWRNRVMAKHPRLDRIVGKPLKPPT